MPQTIKDPISLQPEMTFNPTTGKPLRPPRDPGYFRAVGATAWRYNPWTGTLRTDLDVQCDPLGVAIWEPDWGAPIAWSGPRTSETRDPPPRKHAHYFKPCPFDEIDVYRVLDLFSVTDPCMQHAVKKLLVAGGRGSKDISKDVQEAIDTLLRWQEMRREEGHDATT